MGPPFAVEVPNDGARWAGSVVNLSARTRRFDALYYLLCLGYVSMTLATGWPAYKMWASFAIGPYVLAVAHSLVRLSRGNRTVAEGLLLRRPAPLVLCAAGSFAALIYLAARRAGGDITASLSEVRVIERMARELLSSGSPYLDTPNLPQAAVVFDYSPYTPVMAIFGLPSAIFGAHTWTDARFYCLAVAAAAVWLALRLRSPQRSLAGWQLLLNPLVLLMAAGSGTDIGVIGLIILGLVLCQGGRAGWVGCVLGLAIGMKLTAAPILLIAGALLAVTYGRGAVARYAATLGATTAAVNVPVLLVNPTAYVDNVINFPAGLTAVASSAAGPLPGHLLSTRGDWGRAAALTVLVATAVGLAAWVVTRPPRTLGAAFVRTAIALTAAMLLLPASRVGYAIYPLVMCGAALLWRIENKNPQEAVTTAAAPVLVPGSR